MIINKFLIWLFELSKTNRPLLKILGKLIQIQDRRIREYWSTGVIEMPHMKHSRFIRQTYIHPSDFFDIMDETSQDVRNITESTSLWRAAKFTDKCKLCRRPETPENLTVNHIDNGIRIIGRPHKENWAYLVSKKRLPLTYSIEFDFASHSVVREHLQICFHADSLCRRFRYILQDNEKLYFDVVDHATFFPPFIEKSASIPLHKRTHVKIEVNGNESLISFDGKTQMAVSIQDDRLRDSYFMLLFWNAGTQDIIDVEISNFRLSS